jgi:hypothetical protein
MMKEMENEDGVAKDTKKKPASLLKTYYTKSNESGILVVKYSWMNFLYTVGSIDKNFV